MKPALNDNARYAYRYLQEKYNLQPHQAAGIVGNLMQESTFMTNARNAGDGRDGSDSIGIGQWNQDRAHNFRAFAGENTGNLDTQLDFVMHELQGKGGNGGGSEAFAWNKLKSADNVHDATSAMISYERPSGWSRQNPTAGHGFDNRLSWAGEVLGMSPDEIAAARPTNAQALAQAKVSPSSDNKLFAMIQGKEADAPKPEEPKSHNGILIQAANKIFGTDIEMPSKLPENIPIFGGADISKVSKGFGDLAKTFAETDQLNNQQVQRAAARAQAGRDSAPVEIQFIDYASERRKKKGALGGLGGYFV